MNVFIEGRIRNKNLTYLWVGMLLKTLNIYRFNRDPHINIRFVTKCDGEALGYCSGDRDEVDIEIARTHFGRDLSYLEMMKSLTHEMVHARQYFRGELKNVGTHRIWKNKPANHYSYTDSPWEREAYELEEKIFNECFPIDLPFKN